MKAGTATKLILNRLTTATMISWDTSKEIGWWTCS